MRINYTVYLYGYGTSTWSLTGSEKLKFLLVLAPMPPTPKKYQKKVNTLTYSKLMTLLLFERIPSQKRIAERKGKYSKMMTITVLKEPSSSSPPPPLPPPPPPPTPPPPPPQPPPPPTTTTTNS